MNNFQEQHSLLQQLLIFYARRLENMFSAMKEDIQVVFEKDPAARSSFEVFLTYSGLHAIWAHRLAHKLFKRNWLFLARLISQISRFFTGIEIHPGAQIGRRFFIDHGMGVVIGETCIIGNDVTLYQGVTLGGTGKEKGKRHPTLEDHVLVATGAKVLGNITIGKNSKVGAGSVVLQHVPPDATVVGIPGRVVIKDGIKVGCELDHRDLPDPVADKFREMHNEMKRMREELETLKKGSEV
ncbi:serine O-acetyltransferase [Fictibacillus nanhaiensis]|uniref:Serine acetyltransferase n=1 Tax=Fictibacillus nanhaiensis TaxID=742169 RepID=A0ABS2ZJ37_9BACL|nr:serine O-acetyltransferase [Fictibacillus nanhaiensis]